MKKIRLSNILKIQSLILLYSLVSVLSKLASMQLKVYGLFSYQLIFLIFIMGSLLVIYAFFWQKILKILTCQCICEQRDVIVLVITLVHTFVQ